MYCAHGDHEVPSGGACRCACHGRDKVAKIESFMRGRGWNRDINPLGEIEYTSADSVWQLQVSKDGWWSIGKFTDSDVPNDAYKGGFEAVGRYEHGEEGNTVKELEAAMVSVGAMQWECPYCGESGGDPVTSYSREWQGEDAPIGGWVEFTEEMCTKCTEEAMRHNMKLAAEGY